MQNFEGSATHKFLSKNLIEVALKTTKSNFCKKRFIYSIGINEDAFSHMAEILKVCKQKLGILRQIPFECAKDETKYVELATWNRTLDVIDRFCGLKESPQHLIHECSFYLQPSASSRGDVSNAFENS